MNRLKSKIQVERAEMKMLHHFPTIETERLFLRSWQENDLVQLAEFFANDPAAVFVGGQREPYETAMWLMGRMGQWLLRGYGAFAITDRESNIIQGWFGVSQIPGVSEPDLQWALFSHARGKGYMAEAGRAALPFLFSTTGRVILNTTIHPDNKSSKAAARRIGGTQRSETVQEGMHTLEVWQFIQSSF